MIEWRFARGSRVLTCRVDLDGAQRAFNLTVLPHWDFTRAIVERFQAASAAFERHAELASRLRTDGWRVVDYTS